MSYFEVFIGCLVEGTRFAGGEKEKRSEEKNEGVFEHHVYSVVVGVL